MNAIAQTINSTTNTTYTTIDARSLRATALVPATQAESKKLREIRFAGRAMTWYDLSFLGLLAISLVAIVASFAG